MKRKNKSNKMVINHLINEKLKVLNNILVSFEQVFALFGPLLEKMLLMEEIELYLKDGSIEEAVKQLDNISKQCQKLKFFTIPPELLNNLKN